MDINLEAYVKKEYQEIFKNFLERSGISDQWTILSNLAYLDCLIDGWEDMLNTYLTTNKKVFFMVEDPEQAKLLSVGQEFTIEQVDGSSHLVLPASDREDKEIAMLYFQNISKIFYILPYLRKNFTPNIRLLTDVILVDAKLKRCTDVHFDAESNFDGSFSFVVNFRQGIYLVKQNKYKMTELLLEQIIADMLENRSAVGHKRANLAVSSSARFRLIDPLFPSRCQVAKSIAGKSLTIRRFDFDKAPGITELGFNENTQKMLHKSAKTTNGLTLVSGVFGSGKGTTLNAVGMEMEEDGRLAIASLDDPIEYLRKYNQYEYSNSIQLQEYVDAFKKMDLNVVFLNEVITPEVGEAVFNLVSAGVHVLTTIHTNRVFRIMYKLEELFRDKYLSLIPFINVISYQDKFSICCTNCSRGVAIEHYSPDSDEYKLLTFLGLETIKQPSGCPKCKNGIIDTGIKVVSEHIEFNDQIKADLLKLDLHQQFDYLKEVTSKGECLEQVIKEALANGEILIGEALLKLDTWR